MSRLSRTLHYASATLFFACLAIFCIVLFRRHDPSVPDSAGKSCRNKTYLVCGIVIIATMALMAIFGLYYQNQAPEAQDRIDRYDLVFYLETIGILAFSVSWLTKGRALVPIRQAMHKTA